MSVEPIAVIGLDAKLPCDGDTPEKFYEFLLAGRSARAPIPNDRYNAAAFWHPDNHRDGVIGGKQAHFINANVRAFDAPFFSITPAEASSMDPQQRLLLECVYTALENSGLTMESVAGSLTGTYVGSFIYDYRDVLMKDIEAPMMYTGSGTIASTLAGRVNWFYDLQGPALSCDTACSSSMVALHQAIVGLKSKDCDMAIAAGANLILAPEMGLELNALGVLNPDSCSYSFDERASGYGRSEGIGAIVLKRMSDALRDGDTIRAVIRNSGCNHDGHSPGLTAPARDAQVAVMRKTYAQAGLDPAETRFFEAHGTGTLAGDPVEAAAISEMFTKHRSAEEPLIIGAVKSNIGHSEGASGITSVIKGILTLENGIIPANAHFQKRNPKILEEWNLFFPTTAIPFPRTKTGVRRMSLNSFGVSGTNAHIVMEDAFHFLKEHGYVAPHKTVDVPKLPDSFVEKPGVLNGHVNGNENTQSHSNGATNGSLTNGSHGVVTNSSSIPSLPQLFVLSSHDQDGISRLCNAYSKFLPSMTDSLQNLSYTLAAKRSRFNWRTAIVADSVESLQNALHVKQPATRVAAHQGLAFIFTGQGAQWARMGMELVQFPVFRQSVEAADAYHKTLGCTWSPSEELSKAVGQSRINEAEFSQPLSTVLQVALVDLLTTWGVTPTAIAGHSSGEIAAAYAAGAISRESAWNIAYWRGFYSAKLARESTQVKTTMAAVGLDFDESMDYINLVNQSGFEDVGKLTVACMNSKKSHTISGDAAQIQELVNILTEKKIFARKLTVEMAYHSRYMEPMSEQYAKSIRQIEPGRWSSHSPEPKFFSSTYGTPIDVTELRDASYWTTNLLQPVRFHDAVKSMLKAVSDGTDDRQNALVTDILEVGPHFALKGPLRNIVEEIRGPGTVKYHNALRRGEADIQSIMLGIGSLFTRGINVELIKVNNIFDKKPTLSIGLPRYPFNHSKEYWYESRLSRNFRTRPYARHELLGVPVNDWDGKHDAIWRNWIRVSENPWVEHHKVSGIILYPAAGMLVMAIEGCRQLAERSNPGKTIKGFKFREVSIHAALQVPDDAMGVETHLYVRPVKRAALESKASLWWEFQVCTAQEDDQWREHCCGQVLVEYDEIKTAVDDGLEDKLLQEQSSRGIADAKGECTTKLAALEVYDAWASVGLVFGETFQTLSDSLVNYETGKAFAKVNSTLPLVKALMPKEHVQEHLIHPTSLDGAFQAGMLPLISNSEKKQNNAVVITFIDELWVSGKQHPVDSYLVTAGVERHSRQEHNISCVAVDPHSRQPMVLVNGMILKEVDNSDGSDKPNGDAKYNSCHIDWKPDHRLLSAKETEETFGMAGGLNKYLDILAHANPWMNILLVGADASDTNANLLSTLGERYMHCEITDPSPETIANAQKNNNDDRVRFLAFDTQKEPGLQGLKAGEYDAIVATSGFNTADVDKALRSIIGLMKPSGKLVFTAPADLNEDEIWNARLIKAGFTGVKATFTDGALSVLISSAPSKPEETTMSSTAGTYYILSDDSPTSDRQKQVASRLYSELLANGHAVKSVTISQYRQIVKVASPEIVANSTCILLPELERGLLFNLTNESLSFLKIITKSKRLHWVNKSGSPDTDLVTGFATCIRLERLELDFTIITVQPEENAEVVADKILQIDIAVSNAKDAPETSYQVIGGIIHIPRIVKAPPLTEHINKSILGAGLVDTVFGADPSRSLRLRIQNIGLLDSLCFEDDPLHLNPLADTEVEFKAEATAVNFKDLAVMLGKIQETPVGLESAGIVTRVGKAVTNFRKGDRVFGFAFNGAFSTHVRGLEGTLTHIPEDLSFSQAAVIPIVYTTAYACLYDIGDLGKRSSKGRKKTVLVHAAAGGVGQAAIQLAQREGAEIFATVGSLEKRDFLEKTYGLPRDHIFSSRDVSFKAGIMRLTKGRGVDIVLNSLAGDMLRATWECVAPFGRFAEIGLSDIESRARISMGTFGKGARFEAIELNYMQKTDMERIEDLFSRAMDSVLNQGLKRITPITSYSISNIQNALRHMQSGKHIGKLVIEINNDAVVPVLQQLKPLSTFAPDATYVVSGGFGGLGLEIIRWMVNQGVRNLVVTSRQGPKDAPAQKLVADLEREGVKIVSALCDISDKNAVETALSAVLSDLPPVRGCIQSSMVLVDQIFDDMTLELWQKGVGVKIDGSWNLWETLISKSDNATLDFFIMLSSMTSIIGNPGQTNYTAGNSYQDALARHLASQGHNAIALDIPMMSGVGIVAQNDILMEYLFSIGWSHMGRNELIATLDYYCRPNKVPAEQAQVMPRLWLTRYSAAEGAIQPTWQEEPRFNHMILHGYSNELGYKQSSAKETTSARLAAVKTIQEAESIVLEALLDKLSKVLSVNTAELDPACPMHTYGVDSLVAVEVRTWMTKEIGSDISVFEITGGLGIGQLAVKAAKGSRFIQVEV